MQEIDTGVWGLDDSVSTEEQLGALREITYRIAEEQRARLDAARPEHIWWADAVFFFRDVQAVCSILRASDQQPLSDMVAKVCGVIAATLLLRLVNNDMSKVEQLREELMQEVDLMNAIMDQALLKWRGEQIQ